MSRNIAENDERPRKEEREDFICRLQLLFEGPQNKLQTAWKKQLLRID